MESKFAAVLKTSLRFKTSLVITGTILIILLAGSLTKANAGPVLFFSDLTSGPNTGWNQSSTQGAAVTIWGLNLGASDGTSSVNVGGVPIASNDPTYIAEWATTGVANGVARKMQRITFWLKSTMPSGAQNITVTTPAGTSNALPFTIRNGNIYFIAASGGNNSYNGKYNSFTSGSSGPWASLTYASPQTNSALVPGDIIYVRAGAYTTQINFTDSPTVGTASMPWALVGYPTEWPTFNSSLFTGTEVYWTFAKFKFTAGSNSMEPWGDHIRMVGNWMTGVTAGGEVGIIDFAGGTTGVGDQVYGNYFYGCGNNEYTHNIYINSQFGQLSYVDIGWNEFSNTVNSTSPPHGGIIDMRTANGGSPSNHIYIHDNFFHDSPDEPLYQSNEGGPVTYVYFYNNVMWNLTSPEAVLVIIQADSNSLYANNTLYQGVSATGPVYNINTSTAIVKNNLIYGYSGESAFTSVNGGGLNSQNDLYYNISPPSGSGVTISGTVTGNPLFVNTSTPDLHLQSGSAAINAGVSTSPTVTLDSDGLSRPQATAYDIGAYEYIILPSPPSSLR